MINKVCFCGGSGIKRFLRFVWMKYIMKYLIFIIHFILGGSLSAESADSVVYEHRSYGHLKGAVYDEETDDPVAGVQILIKEAHRSTLTSGNGSFRMNRLPVGKYTLQTFRIGYREYRLWIQIHENDTLMLNIRLTDAPILGEGIIIEAQKSGVESQKAIEMAGERLRQNLGQTVAVTVSNEPGMDQRTMGPAPARPVLRGLSGDRLLILEDKGRTGDLSATSTDHAVVIDPITSDKIEVIRGPAALMYGPNTLGGVINVERGYIPSCLCDHAGGSFSSQFESVSRGYAAGGVFHHAWKSFTFKYDGSFRNAWDISTPIGRLKNTSITTYNASGGASVILPEGYIGASGSYYQSEYGVPGGFVGAHPNGVRIKLNRKHAESKIDWHFENPVFHHQEITYSFTNYFHQEFESNGSIGTQFSVLSYHLGWLNHLKTSERFKQTTLGVWSEYRSYVPGGYIFTPDTKELTLAGFAYSHIHFERWAIHSSLRVDYRTVRPSEKGLTKIGTIRNRSFGVVSGAVSVNYNLTDQLITGVNIMRSGRTPGIEELFSEGPHLASYSFEIGNPELKPESGIGLEYYIRYTGDRVKADFAVFRNRITNYIFPKNSGAVNIATGLPVYQFKGISSVIEGGEFSARVQLSETLQALAFVSYVRGTQNKSDQPLPAIPPLGWKTEWTKRVFGLNVSATARGAGNQNRVAEFEEPTKGYVLFDAAVHYSAQRGKLLHTVVLSAENIADTEYRRHLSRVRSIMPEPGRNVKLMYKVYF